MKITNPGTHTIHAATQGDLRAIDAALPGIQPGVFNLAVRVLGNRDDAANAVDATQESDRLLRGDEFTAPYVADGALPADPTTSTPRSPSAQHPSPP